jgi:hypothetical protein
VAACLVRWRVSPLRGPQRGQRFFFPMAVSGKTQLFGSLGLQSGPYKTKKNVFVLKRLFKKKKKKFFLNDSLGESPHLRALLGSIY